MTCLELMGLQPLMALSSGEPDVAIAVLDGPIAAEHPALAAARIASVGGRATACEQVPCAACAQGTFVAGALVAQRGSPAPSICPGCTLLVRPIFGEGCDYARLPVATVAGVAQAIVECVDAGARVLNISAPTIAPSTGGDHALRVALDHAASRGAIVVAAAGPQSTLACSAITRHPAVIPVAACDAEGRPIAMTELGATIGRRGLSAVGELVESLSAGGGAVTLSGTSIAAPFVTGAIALLASILPHASAADIRRAMTSGRRRASAAPPLLDAWAAYESLRATHDPREAVSA
ncbi:MAG: hypothetical protein QOI73_2464 [Solirubrobacteraceae bacterium]|nr:hypothetical protein [Solirubrobacteraceae bacterium]